MVQSLFNKDAGVKAWNCIKKRLQHSCFTVNIPKLIRVSILKNICEQLLLNLYKISNNSAFIYLTKHLLK